MRRKKTVNVLHGAAAVCLILWIALLAVTLCGYDLLTGHVILSYLLSPVLMMLAVLGEGIALAVSGCGTHKILWSAVMILLVALLLLGMFTFTVREMVAKDMTALKVTDGRFGKDLIVVSYSVLITSHSVVYETKDGVILRTVARCTRLDPISRVSYQGQTVKLFSQSGEEKTFEWRDGRFYELFESRNIITEGDAHLIEKEKEYAVQ